MHASEKRRRQHMAGVTMTPRLSISEDTPGVVFCRHADFLLKIFCSLCQEQGLAFQGAEVPSRLWTVGTWRAQNGHKAVCGDTFHSRNARLSIHTGAFCVFFVHWAHSGRVPQALVRIRLRPDFFLFITGGGGGGEAGWVPRRINGRVKFFSWVDCWSCVEIFFFFFRVGGGGTCWCLRFGWNWERLGFVVSRREGQVPVYI